MEHSGESALARLNRCDLVFIAVPTPYDEGARACDVSSVREVVRSLDVPMCIRSTVPPGTTDALIAETGKAIAFSPEYIGERPGHPWNEADSAGFVICGGDRTACARTREALTGPSASPLRFVQTTARAAELVKYMENTFLATKVAFVNQFYDLAAAANVDFAELRALFLLDARVGESHTEVRPERGFGGKCLPKDMQSILAWADGRADVSLLEAVLAYNDRVRERAPARAAFAESEIAG
jgi:UDPglucose 6-dehydrogenase